ncbi:MAG: DUF5685 family protein [Oscillospiraceae bacterium]
MFGYVRPVLDALPQAEQERFRSAYCGLCHSLGNRYGFPARFILNYDFTFLAILLSDPAPTGCRDCRCIASPCKKKTVLQATPALDLAADESVILAYWQLRDGIADSGFCKGLTYRFLAALLGHSYRKAARLRPGFDRSTQKQLQKLRELELSGCDSMDQAADTFAVLLAGAAEELDSEAQRRVLREILYHLGRWIYLVDAADDLKRDTASGNYNPLALRFGITDGVLDGENRARFATTLDHSIRLMDAAYALWDFGCWSPIVESTLGLGLFRVGKAVLDGEFGRPAKHRGKDTPAF